MYKGAGRVVEITEAEHKKGKRNKKKWGQFKRLWDNINHTHIWLIKVPEGKEREKGTENIFEDIIIENFPNLGKETDI